jgi:acyl-CoA thioester hydrolase
MAHTMKLKAYYEDTDAGGVVYFATYLRCMERARTEFLPAHGIDVYALHRQGDFFVVARPDLRYRRLAHLGDMLTVSMGITGMKHASVTMRHEAQRTGELLVEASVTMVQVDENHRPCRLSESFREAFSSREER